LSPKTLERCERAFLAGVRDVEFRWPRSGEFKVRFTMTKIDIHSSGFRQTFVSSLGPALRVHVPAGTRALYIYYETVRAVKGDFDAFVGWVRKRKMIGTKACVVDWP
jgi:hypothetical protein